MVINIPTVRKVQNEFSKCYGFEKAILWDHLDGSKSHILKTKIEQLVPLPEKGQKRIQELRDCWFAAVWDQRKYTNRNSLTALIYVVVTQSENSLDAMEFSVHPVFRTKRCLNDRDTNAAKCCMIFVDENGRVYQNWNDYKNENQLPGGFMVAPKNGIYTFDSNECAELEVCLTPAGSTTAKLLKVTDTTSAIAGLGAVGVCAVGAATTIVAAPAFAGAAIVGGCVGVYSAIRSGFNLFDRGTHEQSISITDSQARNSWIGVASGALAVGGSGATKLMVSAAAAGREISMMTQVVVNGMNISSIVLSGSGLAQGGLDMYLKYTDDEEISVLDVLQWSASLILFTHSVSNFKLASSIISETQQGTYKAYRDTLSRRQRKIFNKMSKETIRLKGPHKGQMEIIRQINEMPSKQYLNDLYKINKNLNKENVRPSFGGEKGKVLLNDHTSVDSSTLRNNIQHNEGPDVLSGVPRTIPESHNPKTSNLTSTNIIPPAHVTNSNTINSDIHTNNDLNCLQNIAVKLLSGVVVFIKIASEITTNIRDADDFTNIVNAYSKFFNEESFQYILKMTEDYIKTTLKKIIHELEIFIPAETIFYRMCDYILVHLDDFSLKNLLKHTQNIYDSITKVYSSWKTFDPQNGVKKCTRCPGFYSVCYL